MSWVGSYVMSMLGGFADSQIAAIEKTILGRKELLQAGLNMDAALQAGKRFTEANDKFSVAPERTCRVLNDEKETAHAMVLADINRKALTRVATDRLSDGSQTTEKANASLLADHAANYCAAIDVDRGKCSAVSTMPNADVSASTLLAPAGSETLSPEQFRAAQAFTRMATQPTPYEDVPPSVERTSAGQRFLLEQKQAVAMDSLVAGSFARLLAARSPRN
ncbi:hypothetical protein ACSFA0_23715 [Variovorax sp. LT1P1]|uniref:hypothetical protein n=1 Tax=Variovorax sp. LT1P1 TaxID=3443730 RepID=UPI003F467D4D